MKRTKLTHDYTPSIKKAHDFSVNAHEGQVKPGTSNHYIVHLLNVAEEVMNQGGTETLIIACLLKDTLLKTEVRLDQLKDEFGTKIAGIVKELSLPIDWRGVSSVDIPMVKLAETLDKINGLESHKTSEEYSEHIMTEAKSLLNDLGPLVQAYSLIDEDLSIKDLYKKVEEAVKEYE